MRNAWSGFCLVVTYLTPPMLGAFSSCRISCSPCERLCMLRSHAGTYIIDFMNVAVYSLQDWCGSNWLIWSVLFIWFIWSDSFNQTNETNQTN